MCYNLLEPELVLCKGDDNIFNTETLREISLEILKSRCDLKTSSEEEILRMYFEIWSNLRKINQALKKENPNDSIKFLK